MNTMNYEPSTQSAALCDSFRPNRRRYLPERSDDLGICRLHRTAAGSCHARARGDSGSAPHSISHTARDQRATAFVRQTLVLICFLLLSSKASLPLAAQELEAPKDSKAATAQSQPAGTAASASGDNHGLEAGIGGHDNTLLAPSKSRTSAADDNHGLKIEIGSSDSSLLTPEVRNQLSPEQLYKLEIARLESKKYRGFDEDIIIPLSFFVMIIVIVGLALWTRFRRNRMMHETVRLLVEKGQPLPPDIFRENRALTPPASQLRRGIIWTAIGIGLTAFFLAGSHGNWGLGLIPLCIGLGYLLAWKLESNSKPGTGS